MNLVLIFIAEKYANFRRA